jgi:glycosyltransferase involved in cell wall biosynthesis
VELAERGHEVTVLVLTRVGPLAAELQAAGVPIWELGLDGVLARSAKGHVSVGHTLVLWRRWIRLVAELRRRRPDVVHAFLFWSYVLVLPAAMAAGVKLRVSGRRNMGTEKSAHRLYPSLERVADACSHVAVANAEAIGDIVRGTMPKRKVRVIPNGVDLWPAALHVERQPARGVMIANLISYKGHEDLLRALSLLSNPPAMDLYGEGPEREPLERLTRDLDLESAIRFRGRVPEAASHYREAQFAVLASHEEGMPNAVLEAMATGLPVVATAVGGVPEIVDHGRTGILVSPRCPQELAAGIAQLAKDPPLRTRMGNAGRDLVAKRYSWEQCVTMHEALYRAG